MDCAGVGFYTAGQPIAFSKCFDLPISPFKIVEKVLAPLGEKSVVGSEEMELEAEIAERDKNIQRIDQKMKEIEKIEKDIDDEDEWECKECDGLKKLPLIRGPTGEKSIIDTTSRIDRGVKSVFKRNAKTHHTLARKTKERAP